MTDRRRSNLFEAGTIALLLLLPLLFWWRLWTPDLADRMAIPAGDLGSQYYPLQLFAARELAAGRLPAWDPYLNGGQPGLADIQTGFYYPLNLVPNLVLGALSRPFGVGLMNAQIVLHFMLAALFTYLFARRLARLAGARPGAARLAGAVASLSFTYAGYLTSFPVQQITILETAVWLPLVLYCVDRAWAEGGHAEGGHLGPPLRRGGGAVSGAWLAGAALALACALLAGHPQTALYVVYVVVAYSLFRAFSRGETGVPWTRRGRLVFGALAVLGVPALAAALAAVQLWPTIQFIARSTRAGLGYDAVSSGLPLSELTHLLYPGYFGSSPQYVGILAPILAAAAFFVRPARRPVLFWLIVGVAGLLLALGGNTFLYSVAYLLAPGMGVVRNQERIIFLFSFAVSILAGYGALTLVQPIAPGLRRGYRRLGRSLGWALVVMLVLTALFYAGYVQGLQQEVATNLFEGVLRHHVLLVIILAGAVAVFWLRRTGRARRGRAWLALGLIWLNLFTINWRFNQAAPSDTPLFPPNGLVSFLKAQPGTFRVSSAGLLPGGASAGAVAEIEDITGNTPLRLEALRRFEDELGDWRRWQLLNVEYVLARRDLSGPGLEQVYEEGKVKVFRVGDPLPRAWVVYRTEAVDDSRVLAALDAADIDPRAVALLPPGSALAALGGGGGQGQEPSAVVVENRPGHLALDVSPASNGLLVVSQPHYPGWRATVDGRPAAVGRVDYALQGVPLPAGARRVELDYRLPAWPALVGLAALTLTVFLPIRATVAIMTGARQATVKEES